MKLYRPNPTQVTHKGETKKAVGAIPNLDFVVVSACHKEGLIVMGMKVNTPHRTNVMILPLTNNVTGSVIPALYMYALHDVVCACLCVCVRQRM